MRGYWLRLGGLTASAVAGLAVALLMVGSDRGAVRDAVEDLGVWMPLAYVALCVVLTVALVPYPALAGSAGLLFGVAQGTVYAIVGGTLGAVAAFSIARRFGRASVEQLVGPRLRTLLEEIGERGFATVLLVRVVPGVPRQPANYICGLTPVSLSAFTAANVVGMSPYAYAYVALGGSLDDLGSRGALLAIAVLVVLAALGVALLVREHGMRRRRMRA